MAEEDGNCAEKMADTTDAGSNPTQEAAVETTQMSESGSTSPTLLNVRETLPPATPASKPRKVRQSAFPSHSCAMCPGEGNIVCDTCKAIKYCSTQCQESDEPIHTMLCERLSSFQEPPTGSYRRAILFDERPEDAKPRFVWLRVHTNADEDSSEYDQPILGEFLKDKDGRIQSIITKNHVLWRSLDHCIRIEHYSPGWQRESAVSKIVDSRYTATTTWSGTILAYGTAGKPKAPPKLIDLDLQDFQHIVDFLNTSKSSALASDIRYFGKTLQGVRLNCKGDIADPAPRPAIEAVSVPLTHCVFDDSILLPIPSKMHLPILAARYPRRPEYERSIEMYKNGAALRSKDEDDFNPIARDLQQLWLLQDDEQHATTSTLPLEHESRKAYYQGTIILARQDYKPLFPQHGEVLWRYIKYFLEPMMCEASSIHADEEARGNVEKEMSRESFQLYYRHFQTFQDTEDKRKILSPYDVVKKKGSLKRRSTGSFFNDPKRAKWSWSSESEDTEQVKEEQLDTGVQGESVTSV